MKLFMFVMIAALLLVGLNTASAQIPQPILFITTVSALPLEITPVDLDIADLQSGTTYTAIPDGAGSGLLTPTDGISSIGSMGGAEIVGDINAQVLVSFILPQRLYPTGGAGAGFITTRFNNTSAAWGPPGAEVNYFDPNQPTSMSLDVSGIVDIVLGGIFEVPAIAGPDEYAGEALITAQYTGL